MNTRAPVLESVSKTEISMVLKLHNTLWHITTLYNKPVMNNPRATFSRPATVLRPAIFKQFYLASILCLFVCMVQIWRLKFNPLPTIELF